MNQTKSVLFSQKKKRCGRSAQFLILSCSVPPAHCFPAGERVNGWGGGLLPWCTQSRHLATFICGRRGKTWDCLLPAGGIQGQYTHACTNVRTHTHTHGLMECLLFLFTVFLLSPSCITWVIIYWWMHEGSVQYLSKWSFFDKIRVKIKSIVQTLISLLSSPSFYCSQLVYSNPLTYIFCFLLGVVSFLGLPVLHYFAVFIPLVFKVSYT